MQGESKRGISALERCAVYFHGVASIFPEMLILGILRLNFARGWPKLHS
jgi:hypothetical protein